MENSYINIRYGRSKAPPYMKIQAVRRSLFLGRATTTATPRNSLAQTAPRAGICPRPLTAHRQVTAMPQPPIAANFRKSLDVQLNFAAEVAFGRQLADFLAQFLDFILAQVLDASIR